MNNNKYRNKIFKWVDAFFIFVPILVLICSFLIFLFSYSLTDFQTFDITSIGNSYWNYICDFFSSDNQRGNWDFFTVIGSNFFTEHIRNIVEYFFGIDVYLVGFDFWQLFICYFSYLCFYEIFSLLLNVLMWLPRYIRSKVDEMGANV